MTYPMAWTIEADGFETITETFGFKTDVIGARSSFEQRSKLRVVPIETLSFAFAAVERAAQIAESLIFAGSSEILAVPLWHLGSRLTGAVSIGGTLLPIADALDVPYRRSVDDPGLAMVWRDPWTWELFTVAGTSGAGVATSDASALGWANASALVYPVRLARITGRAAVSYLTANLLTGRLGFTVEPV